jgi:hypothetical protein
VSCLGCHYGIEASSKRVFNQQFDHASHTLRGEVACTSCHSDATYFLVRNPELDVKKRPSNPRHGKTTLSAASCDGCHHAPDSKVACTNCHANDTRLAMPLSVTLPLRLKSKNAPTSRAVTFAHGDHSRVDCASCHTTRASVRTVAACATCHEKHHTEATTRCASCHADPRTAHTLPDHLVCTSCHARETVSLLMPNRAFCVSCHVKEKDHKADRECTVCHMQGPPAKVKARILP